ncbi:MAG: DegV family protein [Ktedonobacterales bacterium]
MSAVVERPFVVTPINAQGSPQKRAPVVTVGVVAESSCCLPPELVARYGIQIVPIPFVFGTTTYLDGIDITPAQFYAQLIAARKPPSTSPPPPGAYLDAWRQAAQLTATQQGEQRGVVSVLVDGKISTMQRSARQALELAGDELPGVTVRLVDSLSAGMGQGFVALAAARAAQQGLLLGQVAQVAERVSQRMRLLVTLDTLDYLAQASRIPQVAALIGAKLAIKPVIQIAGGEVHPLARVRTRRRSLDYLFERLREQIPPSARLHAAVQHANAPNEAARFEARIHETFECIELYTTEFTPVMGGYCGPGLLGVAFYCEDDVGEHAQRVADTMA